mgnify:CR=1 FL=1
MKCPTCKEGKLKLAVYQTKTGAYRGAVNKGRLVCNKCGHTEVFG